MSNLITYAIQCGLPCGWSLFCLAGWAITRGMLAGRLLYKRLPEDGFPTDADRRRWWVEDPLDMRRRQIFKATIIWPIVFLVGGGLGFVAYTLATSIKIVAV